MKCPLCNNLLHNKFNFSYCPTIIKELYEGHSNTHYRFERYDDKYGIEEQHVMIVFPYRILTFNGFDSYKPYSIIEKFNESIGLFNTISISNDKNWRLDPIFPTIESKLLSRIQTIVIFS